MFLVFDGHCDAVSAEVALDAQDILVTLVGFWHRAGQVKVNNLDNIPFLSGIVAPSNPLVLDIGVTPV